MRAAISESIYEVAKSNDKVIFIGSDLGHGAMDEFKMHMPSRFFMEGISEQHVIGMAAGLAMEGYIPFVNSIGTFLTRRALEQIIIDVCLHDLPVRLIGNGGGLVYSKLGPTHQAVDDIAITRTISNLSVISPASAYESKELLIQSVNWPGPMYFRLGPPSGTIPHLPSINCGLKIGKGVVYGLGKDVMMISTGIVSGQAYRAKESLYKLGIDIGLIHMHTIKPLDIELILNTCLDCKLLLIIEEHSKIGGLGSSIIESLVLDRGIRLNKVKHISLPDQFISDYGDQFELFNKYDLSSDKIKDYIINNLGNFKN